MHSSHDSGGLQKTWKRVDKCFKKNPMISMSSRDLPQMAPTEVPTSKRTQEQAEKLGIKLATLDTQPKLDVGEA